MAKPKETTYLKIQVPKAHKLKYSRMVYRAMYRDNEEDRPIYLAIKKNPKMPLTEILKMLKVRRRYTAIKQMAINCGLPFTEG